MQRDPIGIEGGINVYVYCDNEPSSQVDPDGLAPAGWEPSFGGQPGKIWGIDGPVFGRRGVFGRGKDRPPGFINNGPVRLGWSWHDAEKTNRFSFHGGKAGTRWHWHWDAAKGLKGLKFGVGVLGVASSCLLAWDIGWALGKWADGPNGRLSGPIGRGIYRGCPACWDWWFK